MAKHIMYIVELSRDQWIGPWIGYNSTTVISFKAKPFRTIRGAHHSLTSVRRLYGKKWDKAKLVEVEVVATKEL